MTSFFAELQKRKVFRAVSAYGIACFVLLQVLDVVGEPLGINNQHLQWLIGAMLVGFPLTVYLSWILDLRPTDNSQHQRARWPGALLAGAATTLFAGGIWWVLHTSNTEPDRISPTRWTEQPRSVAVLPLQDLSPNADFGWLAAGVTSELQRQLGLWEIFDVKPNALTRDWSVDEAVQLTDIFISGNVQGVGDEAQIQLEVVDSRAGDVLWTRVFKGESNEALDLQTQIASAIARYFGETMGALEGPQKPEAYSTYLKSLENRWYGDLEQDVYWLKRTLDIDPEWMAGWAELTFASFRIASVTRNPSDVETARDYLQFLRETAPNPAYWLWLQEWEQHYLLGELSRTLVTAEQLVKLNPWFGSGIVARTMLSAGMFTEAENYFKQSAQQAPFDLTSWEMLAVSQVNLGQSQAATIVADRIGELQRENELVGYYGPAIAYAKSGHHEKADKILALYDSSIGSGTQGSVATRFTAIFYHALLFETSLAKNDRPGAIEAAQWLAENDWGIFAGIMFLRLGDARAETTLRLATSANPSFIRWTWPYAKQHLTVDQHNHPWVLAADRALGYTREFKLQLCQLAATVEATSGLTCDPADYAENVSGN